MATTPARMYQRRRTAAQWTTENPVLASGEIGIATDGAGAPVIKVGNGTTAWNLLLGTEIGGVDFSFGPEKMLPTTTLTTTNGFPRYPLAGTGTTSIRLSVFNYPTGWKGTDVHIGWVNDHTATGDIRIRTILRECDAATESIPGTTISDATQTFGSGGANGGTGLGILASTVTLTPGTFGSFYDLELQRLADDVLDTLAGPIGLIGIGFLRKP